MNAQTLTPPSGKIRGMYVSCGEELIEEIRLDTNKFDSIGNNTPKMKELWNYCLSHYISYISVYGLGQKYNASTNDPIVGNMLYFDAVKKFLEVMHLYHIQVGIVISNKGFLDSAAVNTNYLTSPFFWESPTLPWDTSCASGQRQSNPTQTFSIPENNVLNPSCSGKPEDCYSVFERSEMLKQIVRILQYSCWVRDSTEHHQSARMSSISPNQIPPDSSIYLFDYMSLEYEYWDSTTFMKTMPTYGGKTPEKASWNNFFNYSQMMLYVYGQLCTFTKMELELRLVPSHNYASFPKSQPTFSGDTAAQDMLSLTMQSDYITRAFNRVLVSDYRKDYIYPKMLNKTGNVHTKFAQFPNDLNPDARNKLMPVFSAATKSEKKHCFGEYLYQASAPNDTLEWSEDFFGPLLHSGMVMNDFENAYLTQINTAIATNKKFDKNEEFFGTNIQDTLDTLMQDVVGFMWYNYSTLYNSNRDSVSYQRENNQALFVKSKPVSYYFNHQNNKLIVSPFADCFTIHSTCSILSIQGQTLLNFTINSEVREVDLSFLSSGVYFLIIQGCQSLSAKLNIIQAN